jgi:hypothetical protein
MIFRISDNRNLATVRSYHIALGDSFLRVVRALSVHIRLDCEEQFGNRRLCKDCDQINRLQGSYQFGTLAFGQNRPTGTLQSRNLFVGIDPNYQQVSQGARTLEISHVAGVQNVKAAISEHNPGAAGFFSRYAGD